MTQQSNPPQGDLAHYGVKGMRWGVRKARTGLIETKTKRLDRVASGTGTFRQKAVTAAGLSAQEIGRAGGFRKGTLKRAAANKSSDLKAQSERLASGKAKASDILKAYGTVTLTDIARSTRD